MLNSWTIHGSLVARAVKLYAMTSKWSISPLLLQIYKKTGVLITEKSTSICVKNVRFFVSATNLHSFN